MIMRRILTLLTCLAIFISGAMAQSKKITGKIIDEKGNPVSNASVVVKGTKIGTSTLSDGTFELSVPGSAKALIITSIGFVSQDVSIVNKSSITLILSSASQNLDEVVVTGYGTQKRKDVTGSLVSVKGATVAEKPVQSFEQALTGKAAGVQITTSNAVLNSPPVFRIRGTNSIYLSSYPLIIVDGVPTYTGDYSGTNAAGNALASINPNDIESIDIAKDAAATAIYGSRGANGVVFITTKKGKPGKAKVTYDGWVGWTNAQRLPSLLNTSEYIAFKTSAVNNYLAVTGKTTPPVTYSTATDASGKVIDTRWYDYIYRQGLSNSHNINVSGGNDNSTYYFSAGYTTQQGIIKKNDFKRLNILFNVDSKINSFITIGGKASYSNEQNLAASTSGSLSGEAYNTGGLARLAIVLPPILSPYNNDGSYNINGSAIGSSNISGISSLSYFNPVVALDLNRSNSENNHIQSSAYIQIKPIKYVTLKSLYGIDYLFVSNDLFWTPVNGDGYSYGGYASSWQTNYKTWLWDNTASFDYTIKSKHNINLLIGNEQQRRTTVGFGLNRQNLSDPAYNIIQAGWTNNNTAGLAYGENYLLSSFGRLNYNFDHKYFLSGNIRQDEYSGLGVKKGTFWGASVAWDITKEKFWQATSLYKTFSSLKLKAGYGKVGNINGVADYSPLSTYGSGLYGGASTLAFSSVGNNKLGWETSKQTNASLSFGLFHDRLNTEITYYYNNIDNLILSVPQSPSTGLGSLLQNVGTMYNKGIELQISGTPIDKKNFSWNSTFNLSYNKNQVTGLAQGLTNIQTTTSSLETVNETKVGYSEGYLWVIKTGGVDPTTGKRIFINSAGTKVYYSNQINSSASPKQYTYSTTADGTTQYISPTGGTAITQAADAVMYKNSIPKYTGGWQNDLRYKNFDLSFLFTYELGFYIYYGTNSGLHDQRWWNNSSDVLTDAWSKVGDVNKKYARPIYGDNVSNGSSMPLDINVFNGNFVKLKSLTLSYNLPQTLLAKAKISNMRVYVSGNNLLILTKYPGPDPEVSSNGNSTTAQGVDRNGAPNARIITVGLNVSF